MAMRILLGHLLCHLVGICGDVTLLHPQSVWPVRHLLHTPCQGRMRIPWAWHVARRAPGGASAWPQQVCRYIGELRTESAHTTILGSVFPSRCYCHVAHSYLEPRQTFTAKQILNVAACACPHGRDLENEDDLLFGVHEEMLYARNSAPVPGAQWTGIVTQVAIDMLESGAVDAVVCVQSQDGDRFAPKPVRSPCRASQAAS